MGTVESLIDDGRLSYGLTIDDLTDCRLLILPIADCRLPIADCRLPIADG
jgi:hypothetical protein